MKKISAKKAVLRVLLVTMFGFSFTHSALSGGDLNVRPVSDESKATVSIRGAELNYAQLSIEDLDQSVIYYSESIDNPGDYKKLFDFSNLSDGSYYVIADMEGEKVMKTITIRDSKVVTEKTEESVKMADPMFRKVGNALVCYFENPDAKGVSIKFMSNGEEFFVDKDETGESLFKRYNLTNLPEGTYEVALKSGTYSYTYALVVD